MVYGQQSLWEDDLSRTYIESPKREHKTVRQSADPNFKIVRQNRDLCSSAANVHALFVIITAPSNGKRRDVIRDMLTSDVISKTYTIRILFLIGWPDKFVKRTQNDIRIETRRHRDILQGRFLDTYRNLTYKTVFGFKWISRHCRNVNYVIKIDDDVYVDIYNFFYTLFLKFETSHAVICNSLTYSDVLRKGKWMLNDYIYRHYVYYPVKYCSGYAVVLKGDMVPLLYKASLMTPFFWIDDIFIFGTSRTFLCYVPITNAKINMYFAINGSKAEECFKNVEPCPIIFSTFVEDLYGLVQFRKKILKNKTQTLWM
ncbi:lactosylceramide 1,3-N-acetyl-beta-D-glucosaminyltransferase-like [Haliotis asinina]|uniref:lactosylceramide 1,3-N-acetyl-beta-D-glucosaminyltransferase-like n=1 Tax=Haliotis asinina TaxID=109174 RepID=UPI0035324E66